MPQLIVSIPVTGPSLTQNPHRISHTANKGMMTHLMCVACDCDQVKNRKERCSRIAPLLDMQQSVNVKGTACIRYCVSRV